MDALFADTLPKHQWLDGFDDECNDSNPWQRLVQPWLSAKVKSSVIILLGKNVGGILTKPPQEWPSNDILKLVGLAKQQKKHLTVLSTRLVDDTYSEKGMDNWRDLYGKCTDPNIPICADQDQENYEAVVAATEYVVDKHCNDSVLLIAVGVDFKTCGPAHLKVLEGLAKKGNENNEINIERLIVLNAPDETNHALPMTGAIQDYFSTLFRFNFDAEDSDSEDNEDDEDEDQLQRLDTFMLEKLPLALLLRDAKCRAATKSSSYIKALEFFSQSTTINVAKFGTKNNKHGTNMHGNALQSQLQDQFSAQVMVNLFQEKPTATKVSKASKASKASKVNKSKKAVTKKTATKKTTTKATKATKKSATKKTRSSSSSSSSSTSSSSNTAAKKSKVTKVKTEVISTRKTKAWHKGECPSCKREGPLNYYCSCIENIDFKSTLKKLIEFKIGPINLTGKKRKKYAKQKTNKEQVAIKKQRTAAAQVRRKKGYKERADAAKPYFDKWFKAEVEVDTKYKQERIGKEALEKQYHIWSKKNNVPEPWLTTSHRKEGMNFSKEVLKRITAQLKMKKDVKFMANAQATKCIPYIKHKKLKT